MEHMTTPETHCKAAQARPGPSHASPLPRCRISGSGAHGRADGWRGEVSRSTGTHRPPTGVPFLSQKQVFPLKKSEDKMTKKPPSDTPPTGLSPAA